MHPFDNHFLFSYSNVTPLEPIHAHHHALASFIPFDSPIEEDNTHEESHELIQPQLQSIRISTTFKEHTSLPLYQVAHTIEMHQTTPILLHGDPVVLENHLEFVSTSSSHVFLPSKDLFIFVHLELLSRSSTPSMVFRTIHGDLPPKQGGLFALHNPPYPHPTLNKDSLNYLLPCASTMK